MKHCRGYIVSFGLILTGILLASNDILSQSTPLVPLPDRQMEITTFGYRINGRFDFLWYPGQKKFREEFEVDPKVNDAYRHYLKTAYLSKGVRWTAVGLMSSLFFIQHTSLSSGLVIGGSVLTSGLSVSLTGEKQYRLHQAVDMRNEYWYHKVRQE